jgi:hypothetical protein
VTEFFKPVWAAVAGAAATMSTGSSATVSCLSVRTSTASTYPAEKGSPGIRDGQSVARAMAAAT